jgi:hypothetical protein
MINITNYDSWQSNNLPKLKAKLSQGDKAEDFYRTNAIGIQVNGSTVSLGLLDHLGKLIQIPVLKDPKAGPDQKEDALKTLFQMVADVVKYQKSQDPNSSIDIDISAAGFAPKSHPEFFQAKSLAPVKINGLTYMSNFRAQMVDQSVKDLIGDYEKNKFHNFQDRLKTALGQDRNRINFSYQDEASETKSTQPNKGFTVNMTTMNDTNTLAFQLGEKLNQGDTVIGVVGGTGFNVGVNKNYNGEGSFDSISNLECGASVLPKQDLLPFLSPIDQFKLQTEPKTPPEWFFAGGQEDQGLVNIAQKIRETFNNYNEKSTNDPDLGSGFELFSIDLGKYTEEFSDDAPQLNKENQVLEFLISLEKSGKTIQDFPNWLTGSERLTNRLIMQKARDGEPLALAMVTDFAKRWGGFIKNRLDDKGLLADVNNPKYAITGSHLQDLLSIESAKTAFAKALSVPEANLINIEKGEMDGMQAILKAKIATARAGV